MKNIMRVLCHTQLGVILLVATLWGQTAGTLRGRVLDEAGAVIPGAKVTLEAAVAAVASVVALAAAAPAGASCCQSVRRTPRAPIIRSLSRRLS